MPRPNKPSTKATRTPFVSRDTNKATYRTKKEAESAAREAQKYDQDIVLSPYQSLEDGKWRLTSRNN